MRWIVAGLISCGVSVAQADEPSFQTIRLTDAFYGEGAAIGDFNKDGHGDVVSGPFLYFGPDFTMRTELYDPISYDPHAYSKSFLQYVDDVDGDGWDDMIEIGFPGEGTYWFQNPQGKRNTLTGNTKGHWEKHLILAVTDNESPGWADVDGDGHGDLIAQTDGRFGYASRETDDPTGPWKFHAISAPGQGGRFTHGIGVGDINGDGKLDFLANQGWWEQPASLEGDPEWKHHPVEFAPQAAQMYAFDVNGDGLNDVVTALHAHGYGLVWHEQQRDGDKISFKQHIIMGDRSHDNPRGTCFSQIHAIDLADMDGDGVLDIVTGKRFWAHGPEGDVEPDKPPVLYYFRTVRGEGGAVTFEPVEMHALSGVGTQVHAKDINGDGKPDVVVGNKLGTFVTLQK